MKSRAAANDMTVSAYVAKMVRDHLGEGELDAAERDWVHAHYEANVAKRQRADEKTAAGYYRRKRRGRPRKRGPKKGWKKALQKNAASPAPAPRKAAS